MALCAVTACTGAGKAATPKDALAIDLPTPSDDTYGVYLNDTKVGWMRTVTKIGATVDVGLELHAAVGGMGQVAKITVTEQRSYDRQTRALVSMAFVQDAATGSVRMQGRRDGQELVLDISAGNATQTQRFAVHETLDDALVPQRLAKAAQLGAKATAQHFDPSLQKNVHVDYTVVGSEQLLLAGVSTRALRVDARYDELDITETSWLDDAGRVLETRVGGFFVARLEPPEVARRLDYHQDLLVSATVKAPRPLVHPSDLTHLKIVFTGFEKNLPPSSARQKVTRQGDAVVIELVRDPPLPDVAWGPNAAGLASVKSDLEPTPFIQSNAPEIKAAAAQAIGDAKRFSEVVTKLTGFVFDYIKDEYVPAYSNALEALASARGDCTEHSVLFVALARALGIPARVAVGIAYWPPGNGFGWHAWAEVYAAGRWYTVDPTWNQPVADATHVKLADGGPAEQARIVMLLGRLQIRSLEP